MFFKVQEDPLEEDDTEDIVDEKEDPMQAQEAITAAEAKEDLIGVTEVITAAAAEEDLVGVIATIAATEDFPVANNETAAVDEAEEGEDAIDDD